MDHLERLERLSPGGQGENLGLTVLYESHSLESGLETVDSGLSVAPGSLRSEEGTTTNKTFSLQPRPESGLDCLMRAIFARGSASRQVNPRESIQFGAKKNTTRLNHTSDHSVDYEGLVGAGFRGVT